MITLTKQKFLSLLVFFSCSFFLHLLWENLHAPLYNVYTNFVDFFPRLLFATATGDMIFMFVIYLVIAIVHRNFWWILDKTTFTHPATWILPIIVGSLLAVSFELWAVNIDHRWAYTTMPIIPILQVGLTPILQMIVLPLLVIFVSKKNNK